MNITLNQNVILSDNEDMQSTLRNLLECLSSHISCCILSNKNKIWCAANEYHLYEDSINLDLDVLLQGSRLLVLSSGTTKGKSKKIIYDINRFLSGMIEVSKRLGLSANRISFSYVNPRYIYGLTILVSHAIANEPVFFVDNFELLKNKDLSKYDSLDIYMTPVQAVNFLLKNIVFPKINVRFIFAGDRLTNIVAEKLSIQYPDAIIANMYGQVELGPRVSIRETISNEFIEGNVGFPLEGVKIDIKEPDKNGVGSLFVQSKYQMLGYLDDNKFEHHGISNWIDTGDRAKITPSGELLIIGRSDRHINIAGYRIDLVEFERCILTIDGIANCRAKIKDSESLVQRVSISVQLIDDFFENSKDIIENKAKELLRKRFGQLYNFIDIKFYESNTKGAIKL